MHCINLTDEQRQALKPWAIAAIVAEVVYGASMAAYVVFLLMTGNASLAVTGVWISATWITVRAFQHYCSMKMNAVAKLTPLDGLFFSMRRVSAVLMSAILIASGTCLVGQAIGWW